jgi:hypothetical protein
MLVTLIKGGDPVPRWGGSRIFDDTFDVPNDSAKTLKTFFPEMKPLKFGLEVKVYELPRLTCNTCQIVGLFYQRTLEEVLVQTHIYFSMRILASDAEKVDGLYLLCDRCWTRLTMLLYAKAAGDDKAVSIMATLWDKLPFFS